MRQRGWLKKQLEKAAELVSTLPHWMRVNHQSTDDFEDYAMIMVVFICDNCTAELYENVSTGDWAKLLAKKAKELGWHCKKEDNASTVGNCGWVTLCPSCKHHNSAKP